MVVYLYQYHARVYNAKVLVSRFLDVSNDNVVLPLKSILLLIDIQGTISNYEYYTYHIRNYHHLPILVDSLSGFSIQRTIFE